jgi:glycosyltransferase involved in cell wall biosynthesis
MKKYDLSILIPSRNEEWLSRTIDDIIAHKEGNTEIIVGLDGKWADPSIPDHPDVRLVYFPESIGQRAATNQCARLSSSKYVMKVDAHTAWDQGFDVKMMDAFKALPDGDSVTMVPVMRNLHVFNWICPAGHARYQGPSGPCQTDGCGKPTTKDVVWIPKLSPQSKSYCFDETPHFNYFGAFNKRPEGKPDDMGLTETMSLQGSCFMSTRAKYWELDMGNEAFGSWGSQGIQIACSTWLSGGRVLVNHKTWYAHLFRTAGGDFSFPYPQSGRNVQKAKELAGKILSENKWPKQILPLSWLLDRFWPVPGWSDEARAKVTKAGLAFSVIHPLAGSTGSHHLTSGGDALGQGENVPPNAMGLSTVDNGGGIGASQVLGVGNKLEMSGIATPPVLAGVIKDGNTLSTPHGNGANQPCVEKPMGTMGSVNEVTIPVSVTVNTATPIPATGQVIDTDVPNKLDDVSGGRINDSEILVSRHVGSVSRSKSPSKGMIFYTDNRLPLKLAQKVQSRLRDISKSKNIPIVSASLKPMDKMGKNIHIARERGIETYFTQIVAALEASDADIVYFAEHDVIYHPSHFDFTPPDRTKFYYDQNWWKLRLTDGFAVHWDADQCSGLVCYRDIALEWYRNKLASFKKDTFDRKYEPASGEGSVAFKSAVPMIDIRHAGTLTKDKWSLADFRNKSTCVNWVEGYTIPGWGETKEAFADILLK